MGLSCVFLFISYFEGETDITEQIHSHLFVINHSEAGMSHKVEEKGVKIDSYRMLERKMRRWIWAEPQLIAAKLHEGPVKVP